MSLTVELMTAMLLSLQEKQKEERAIENTEIQKGFSKAITEEVSVQLSQGLQPIEARQTILESEVSELKKVIFSLQNKQNVASNAWAKPPSISSITNIPNTIPRQTITEPVHSDNIKELKDLIHMARSSLTFSPISNETFKFLEQNNPDNKDLCELAVRSFLCSELKMPESFVSELNIVEAWTVENTYNDGKKLHAKFEFPYIVGKIFSYASNLNKGKRIMNYIPKPMQARHRALEEIAFDLRHTHNMKTMIKCSPTDLVLYTRGNAQQKWVIHATSHHSHLPPIDMKNTVTTEPSLAATTVTTEPSVFVDMAQIQTSSSQSQEAIISEDMLLIENSS